MEKDTSKNCKYTLIDKEWNGYKCSGCLGQWTLQSTISKHNKMNYCPLCGAKITNNPFEWDTNHKTKAGYYRP